jgi:hypothetical protein
MWESSHMVFGCETTICYDVPSENQPNLFVYYPFLDQVVRREEAVSENTVIWMTINNFYKI